MGDYDDGVVFLVIFDGADSRSAHAGWIYLVATHLGTALLIGLFVLLAWPDRRISEVCGPGGRRGCSCWADRIRTKAGLYPRMSGCRNTPGGARCRR